MKLCNKHKLQFRAVCPGWTGTFQEGIIYMDLRRMNRIIEINEKNMYAVVEPYVIFGPAASRVDEEGLALQPERGQGRTARPC